MGLSSAEELFPDSPVLLSQCLKKLKQIDLTQWPSEVVGASNPSTEGRLRQEDCKFEASLGYRELKGNLGYSELKTSLGYSKLNASLSYSELKASLGHTA